MRYRVDAQCLSLDMVDMKLSRRNRVHSRKQIAIVSRQSHTFKGTGYKMPYAAFSCVKNGKLARFNIS